SRGRLQRAVRHRAGTPARRDYDDVVHPRIHGRQAAAGAGHDLGLAVRPASGNALGGSDMAKILGIGDSMCDRNMTTGVMYPGGQSLNIPVNAKLQGADAAFMGCMGNDEVMEHLLRTMDELGVDHSHCRFYPVPSHTAYYKVAGNERVFLDPPPVKPNP